jgi:hypothetical protein
VAVSLGLAVWLAVAASDDATAPVLALGLAGSAATAAALIRPVALGPALAASGASYAVLLAIDEPPLDSRAAGVAAALLAVGELTGWSRELASSTTDEPGGAWRRPMWIAGAVAVATSLAWVLVAMVDLARVEGLAVEAVGALAALAAVFLLVRRSAA